MIPSDTQNAEKTYRGTMDEVFSRRDEIPLDALVELRVLGKPQASVGKEGFEEHSLADMIREIGTVGGLPPDMAAHPEKYMQGFGKPRT